MPRSTLIKEEGYGPEVATHPQPFDGRIRYRSITTARRTRRASGSPPQGTTNPVVNIFVNGSLVFTAQWPGLIEEQRWDVARIYRTVAPTCRWSRSPRLRTTCPRAASPSSLCAMRIGLAGEPGTPHCDMTSDVCVQCTQTADCGVNEVCSGTSCVAPPCVMDSDCAATPGVPYCDLTRDACVQCTTTSECSGGDVCQNDVCVAPQCTSDADCSSNPADPYCDVTAGLCGVHPGHRVLQWFDLQWRSVRYANVRNGR